MLWNILTAWKAPSLPTRSCMGLNIRGAKGEISHLDKWSQLEKSRCGDVPLDLAWHRDNIQKLDWTGFEFELAYYLRFSFLLFLLLGKILFTSQELGWLWGKTVPLQNVCVTEIVMPAGEWNMVDRWTRKKASLFSADQCHLKTERVAFDSWQKMPVVGLSWNANHGSKN